MSKNPFRFRPKLLGPHTGSRFPLLQQSHHRCHDQLRIAEPELNARTIPRHLGTMPEQRKLNVHIRKDNGF